MEAKEWKRKKRKHTGSGLWKMVKAGAEADFQLLIPIFSLVFDNTSLFTLQRY